MTLQDFVLSIFKMNAPGQATFTTRLPTGEMLGVIWTRTEEGSDREGLNLFTVLVPDPDDKRLLVALGVEVMGRGLDEGALSRLASCIRPGRTAREIEQG